MKVKMKANRWKIVFGLLMIFLFVLFPLTMAKGTALPTAVGEDAWRRWGSMSTIRFDLATVGCEQLYTLDRQTGNKYIFTEYQEDLPITLQWTLTYGGPKDDWAEEVIQTADNGFALVGTSGYWESSTMDALLVKIDPHGVVQWNRTYDSLSNNKALAIIQTADGGFALAGTTNSSGAGKDDFWLVKTDTDGYTQWTQTYGGHDWDRARAVIQTMDGGFALIGVTNSFSRAGDNDAWLVKTDTDGYTQWTQTYGGHDWDWAEAIIQTADGGFALAGYTESYHKGFTDALLVKTDLRGVSQWNRTYGGPADDWISAVIQMADGGLVLAGSTYSYGTGGLDAWLVKTNPRGMVQWNRTYGGSAHDGARSVVQTIDGGFALAGVTESFGAGKEDFWLVKTDHCGMPQWNRTYGGPADDLASTVIQTADGGLALAGSTCSYGKGGLDVWLVKLVPIPETPLTTPEMTTPKVTTPELPITTIVTTTEIPLPTEFTPEFKGFSILLAIPILFWLRRKLHRG